MRSKFPCANISRNALNILRHRLVKRSWKLNGDEMKSLQTAINEKRYPYNTTNIIFIKRKKEFHHVFGYDDFAIAFMSNEQITAWNTFSKRAVCVDTTYRFSKHKFKLVTLLVIGYGEAGIPVASFLTSKENTDTLKNSMQSTVVSVILILISS